MEYHVHIYYNSETRAAAHAFLVKHRLRSWSRRPWISTMIDENIGPHTSSMFQVNVDDDFMDEYMEFFNRENPGLSMLLHEVTGDEIADHTTGTRWFGPEVPMDLSYFDYLKE